jgi:selenocysteine lyase/cysteine desulfurase
VGSALVIDGTQSVGAIDFDVAAIQPDFLFCAGYKWLLCPYRLSLCYSAPKYHKKGRPIEHHGWGDLGGESGRAKAMWGLPGSEDDDGRLVMGLDETARRFDMGERSDFSSLAAACDAVSQLGEWQKHGGCGGGATAALLSPMVNAIAEEGKARGWAVPADLSSHMVGLQAPGGFSADLPAALAARNVHVSVRGPCLRVSPHVYNSLDDVAKLFDALDHVME